MKPCTFCGGVNEDHKEGCYFILMGMALDPRFEDPTKEEFEVAWNTRQSIQISEFEKVIGEFKNIEEMFKDGASYKFAVHKLKQLINKEQ